MKNGLDTSEKQAVKLSMAKKELNTLPVNAEINSNLVETPIF